ncbi:hypothetical protein BDR04DRAFT_1163754 [Suillus decipiens]|nr:hypothetical protein BDR04DRAFT_1163754 [Suillus decipiens]
MTGDDEGDIFDTSTIVIDDDPTDIEEKNQGNRIHGAMRGEHVYANNDEDDEDDDEIMVQDSPSATSRSHGRTPAAPSAGGSSRSSGSAATQHSRVSTQGTNKKVVKTSGKKRHARNIEMTGDDEGDIFDSSTIIDVDDDPIEDADDVIGTEREEDPIEDADEHIGTEGKPSSVTSMVTGKVSQKGKKKEIQKQTNAVSEEDQAGKSAITQKRRRNTASSSSVASPSTGPIKTPPRVRRPRKKVIVAGDGSGSNTPHLPSNADGSSPMLSSNTRVAVPVHAPNPRGLRASRGRGTLLRRT